MEFDTRLERQKVDTHQFLGKETCKLRNDTCFEMKSWEIAQFKMILHSRV